MPRWETALIPWDLICSPGRFSWEGGKIHKPSGHRDYKTKSTHSEKRKLSKKVFGLGGVLLVQSIYPAATKLATLFCSHSRPFQLLMFFGLISGTINCLLIYSYSRPYWLFIICFIPGTIYCLLFCSNFRNYWLLIILLSFQALFIVLLHQWLPVLLSFQALFIAMLSFQALIISDGFALIPGTYHCCDFFPGTIDCWLFVFFNNHRHYV